MRNAQLPHVSFAGSLPTRSCAARHRALGVLLAASQALACANTTSLTSGKRGSSPARASASSFRYRLPLRANPVDSGEAFRCYSRCQSQARPEEYVECLQACPGFETTPGAACEPDEVPPIAACFTVRQLPLGSEPQPDTVVVGTVAGFVLIVALASVYASSEAHCPAVLPASR